MSDVKFSRNLFLEKAELDRLKKSLKTDGFERDFLQLHERFGIVYNQYFDPNFSYFKTTPTLTPNTINVAAGLAYDKNHKVLISIGKDLIIPTQNQWYWLKVTHKYKTVEEGTVTIGGSSGGQLRGIGTKFTEVLRGQPNFPTKIKFSGSTNYTQEYEVLQVVDDTTAFLQGSFPIVESGIKFSVIGTFTPGYYPPEDDKFPFQYDDFDYSFDVESGLNVMPSVKNGEEFFIARVISQTTGITIEDKRRMFVCKPRAEMFFAELPANSNPLIAIDNVKKTAINDRLFYMTTVSWGFTITSETRNSNSNKVLITGGSGGKYKTPASFVDGNFDGWRYYYIDGDYSKVISSVKIGSNIELQLDCIKHDGIGSMICPNCEEIEVVLRFGTSVSNVFRVKREWFHTFTPVAQITIEDGELDPNYKTVGLKYRAKSNYNLTQELDFNINTYNVQGLADVTNKDLVLSGASTGGVVLAWRGIDPVCLTSTFPQTIYYKIVEQGVIVQPIDYFPNGVNPTDSTDRTTEDLKIEFYSDIGLTTPLVVNMNNLKILVKRKQTIQQTFYDVPTPGSSTTYNQVIEIIDVYTVNSTGNFVIAADDIEKTRIDYEHPTGDPLTRRQVYNVTNTFFVFPTSVLVFGRNGQRSFTNLEQYDTANSVATGIVKPNQVLDPDYIAPSTDNIQCPFVVPAMRVLYGYKQNIKKVEFTGSTNGVRTATLVANTEAGGFVYQLQAYDDGEPVTLKVRSLSLDTGNQTGKVWVRVSWRAAGATSLTFTEVQITNDVETTLAQTFTNIEYVNISNY